MADGEYQELFFTEAREYLGLLNNALVALEQDPSRRSAVDEVFRAAHTLKSMAATMGYQPVARLAHEMESALEPVRVGGTAPSEELLDALFTCLDQLERWLSEAERGEPLAEGVLSALLYQLQAAGRGEKSLSSAATGSRPPRAAASAPGGPQAALPAPVASDSPALAFTPVEREALSEALSEGLKVHRISVELAPDCAFKEVRAFMVLRNLNELAEVVKSVPVPEELEAGRFGRGFTLVVVSEHGADRIRETLSSVSEVSKLAVEPLTLERIPPVPTAPAGSHPLRGAPAAGGEVHPETKSSRLPTVRVHTGKLDRLMALVQELVITKIRFEKLAADRDLPELEEAVGSLHHVSEELQDEILQVRLLPLRHVFERFPRLVRDLSKELGKEARLVTEGDEIELDRTILDEMGEVLVHLLRNALDHGLEPPEERRRAGKDPVGVVRLAARRERAFVALEVSDDGRGIDTARVRLKAVERGFLSAEEADRLSEEEVLRLLALPGFSTAERVTDVSGRGVGVDVVKTKVEALGGQFRISSRRGEGTVFHLKFPLTVAILRALLVRVEGRVLAVPIANVVETVDVLPKDKTVLQQREALVLREEVIPLISLRALLEMPERSPVEGEPETVLVAEIGGAKAGIVVDSVDTQLEIALKPLDPSLRSVRGYAGATILGDGSIALVLDLGALLEDYRVRRLRLEAARRAGTATGSAVEEF